MSSVPVEKAEEFLRFVWSNRLYTSLSPETIRIVGHGTENFDSGAELVNVDKRASLDLRLSLSSGLPSEFAYEDEHYVISASGSRADLLNIAVNLYEGELRYFFADHKNYYYLPMEDRAIHKSVGAFVERSARRQATKETCYERKQGLFLPEPEIIFAPVYKSAFRSEQQYALFDRQILTNECKLLEYASAVIRYAAAKINTKTREKMV